MSSIIFVLLLINSAGEIFKVAGEAEDLENGFILDKNDCLGWETVVVGTIIDDCSGFFLNILPKNDCFGWGTVIDDGTVAVVVELWGTVIDEAIAVCSGLFLNILPMNDCLGCVFCAVGIVICGE